MLLEKANSCTFRRFLRRLWLYNGRKIPDAIDEKKSRGGRKRRREYLGALYVFFSVWEKVGLKIGKRGYVFLEIDMYLSCVCVDDDLMMFLETKGKS